MEKVINRLVLTLLGFRQFSYARQKDVYLYFLYLTSFDFTPLRTFKQPSCPKSPQME